MINTSKISGFNELLPEEEIIQQYVLDIVKKEFKLNAFLPMETASVEKNEVLMAKDGIETKEIYQLTKLSKSDDVKDFSLRFDLTLPLARYVSQNYSKLVFPFKRYQIQKVWRGERPAKGRFREFYQADIDIIGENKLSLSYDAEIISIINNIFKTLNIGDFKFKINNRKLQLGLFQELNLIPKEKIIDFIESLKNNYSLDPFINDKRDETLFNTWKKLDQKEIERRFIENQENKILKILDDAEKISIYKIKESLVDLSISKEAIEKLIEFINLPKDISTIESFSNNELYQEGIANLKEFLSEIDYLGVKKDNIQIDTKIARGLGYYTGIIFETELLNDASLGSVCSGGRYENLTKDYSKIKLPGVGISIGISRLISIILEKKLVQLPNQRNAEYILFTSKDKKEMIELSREIRNNDIPCEITFLDSYKKEIKYALKKGYRYAILSKGDGQFILRDLNETERDKSDRVILKQFLLMLLVQ